MPATKKKFEFSSNLTTLKEIELLKTNSNLQKLRQSSETLKTNSELPKTGKKLLKQVSKEAKPSLLRMTRESLKQEQKFLNWKMKSDS